ncbi:transcription initiation factor IIA subunit 2 isoform X1 [Chenopodium quinoa]|nr:transcription initiation factor IIA subunit 2 isoform X1 [Chenopodium quinoa]
MLGYKNTQISPIFVPTSPNYFRASCLISLNYLRIKMATFELYRRSTIGMCLTETLDEMVQSGTLSPELAIQVLVQFDKSMTEALEAQVKSKVTIKGHLHTYRFCDNVWTFILQDALFKSEELQENVSRVKIVACDSKLLTQ